MARNGAGGRLHSKRFFIRPDLSYPSKFVYAFFLSFCPAESGVFFPNKPAIELLAIAGLVGKFLFIV